VRRLAAKRIKRDYPNQFNAKAQRRKDAMRTPHHRVKLRITQEKGAAKRGSKDF
jgi:hypothetical protein